MEFEFLTTHCSNPEHLLEIQDTYQTLTLKQLMTASPFRTNIYFSVSEYSLRAFAFTSPWIFFQNTFLVLPESTSPKFQFLKLEIEFFYSLLPQYYCLMILIVNYCMYGLYHKIVSYSCTGRIHYGLSFLLFHTVRSSFSQGCQMHYRVRKTDLVQWLLSKFFFFQIFDTWHINFTKCWLTFNIQ